MSTSSPSSLPRNRSAPRAAAPTSSPVAGTGAYGLAMPTVADLRTNVTVVHGPDGPRIWQDLLTVTRLTGEERGREPLERLLRAMDASGDVVTALCARALRIRLSAYDHLSSVRTLVRSTPVTPEGKQ